MEKKFFWFFGLLVLLDQFFKYALEGVDYGLVNYVTNTGAAFGFFKGYNLVFVVVSVLFILLVWKFYDNKEWIAFCFLLSGVIGNLLDRLCFGFVRDFIDLKVWPVFNLADAYICIGVFLLLVSFWRTRS